MPDKLTDEEIAEIARVARGRGSGLINREADHTWTLRLNRYQRDNLLYLINAIGYPAGPSWPNPHIDPALRHRNTGDWVGELAQMLRRSDDSITIDASDRVNHVYRASDA